MTNAFNEQPLLQFDQAAQPAAFDRATPEFSKDHRKRLTRPLHARWAHGPQAITSFSNLSCFAQFCAAM